MVLAIKTDTVQVLVRTLIWASRSLGPGLGLKILGIGHIWWTGYGKSPPVVESHTQSVWTGYGKSPPVVESHTQSMWTGYEKSPPVVESHTLFSYIYFYLCCPLIFPYYYLMNGILLTKVRLFDLEHLRMLLPMMESNILSSKQLCLMSYEGIGK